MRITVKDGSIKDMNPKGHSPRLVHFGGMKFADPAPADFPLVTIMPVNDEIEIVVEQKN